ncbi:unnamed protein product [Cylindrotheca closterium]|uniref:Uncharacterized protein n=1 Tax=Cylindrotheca closterium TaxID=2856 RepID=A0AAD2CKT2_9STRA|nr:unnamed protein product [Cylindrotheca closterium]
MMISLVLVPTLVSSFSTTGALLNHYHHPTIIYRDHNNDIPDNSHLSTNRQHNTRLNNEKPEWLADAMGGSDDSRDAGDAPSIEIPKLTNGLSGFCLDPALGFVAILSCPEISKFVAVTVVPNTLGTKQVVEDDIMKMPSRLTSPRALTLVQLAGGMDLGTPILPPDALWQIIVREGIDAEDDDEDDDIGDDNAPPPLVTLLGIDVVPNEDYDSEQSDKSASLLLPTKATGWDESWMQDDDRKEKILQQSVQVLGAVKGLPGLQAVTLEQVSDAMIYCSNEEGALDRQGFSHLLDYMRRVVGVSSSAATDGMNSSWKTDSKVKFVLNVNLVQQDSIKTISVTTLDAFSAIGLSMRHKIQLQVAPECFEEDSNSILQIFPAFRSVQELWEDAKIMDGFIPSMFEQAKKQQPPSQMG